MNAIAQRTFAGEPALSIDRRDRRIRAVITTRTPDRAGDIVLPSGLRNADEFLRNPVVLWAHERSLPPVGTCEALNVDRDRIVATTRCSDSSAFAREVFELYAEGILRGWSIGFTPVRTVPRDPGRSGRRNGRTAGVCFEEWELLEYSAVPVPENPEALTLAVRKGIVRDPDLRDLLRIDVLAPLVASGWTEGE